MQPFTYVDAADFKNRVDLSVPGMMQDCAECHVGGGAMEYVPAPNLDARTSLRDIAIEDVNGNGPITGYTAFNYFIDTYDVDGDGDLNEVQPADFSQLGVIEMDCLLCHLKGYDYTARRDMLRAAKFDASRAVGAGVATQNNVAFGTADYGTAVNYNDLVVDNGGYLEFGSSITANLKATPPSDNCAFCHFNHGAVDWKKRGDNWKKDVTYDVHTVLGCMGCHEGKTGSEIGTTGDPASTAIGQCDPAKGNAPYSSLWNANDNTIKTCSDCHDKAGWDANLGTYSNDYGAPNPIAAHQRYGFTAQIVQKLGDGVVNASHLDILECSVCHVRKVSIEAWNTGGAVVDATGPDADGRLADHENQYVSRLMYDGIDTNLSYAWKNGKIYAANVLNTLFWRDKNAAADANGDGQLDAMDALLMTDVLAVDIDNGWSNLVEDNAGLVTSAEIGPRITALNSYLDSKWGTANGPFDVKMATLAVPFKVNHNVSPASYALGHACSDCHDPGKFFDRTYAMQGDAMNLTFDSGQVTPFTALGGSTPTDFHPNLKDRNGASIPLQVLSGNTELRDIETGEMLYPPNAAYTTESGTPLTGRAAWVSHLNNDIGDGSAYGYDVSPTASIVTDLSSPFEVGTDVILSANDSAAPGSQYFWNVQDKPGTLTGQGPITYTLNNPGTYQVLLTVVGPQGNLVQQVGSITVAREVAQTTATPSTTAGSATVNIALANLPTYDQLYVRYGDGTWETIAGSPGPTQTVIRDYRLRNTYLHGTDYVYTTTVQVKNVGLVVETIKFTVTIPQ